LLAETVSIYGANLSTLLLLAGGVVLVVDVILGLGLGELTARYRSRSQATASLIRLAASTLVTTPLITAMLARAVLDVRSGRRPSAATAASAGLDLFAPLLLAVVLYAAAVFAGALAFVVPGVYIAVSWYFVAQAVVIDGRRGTAALARSGELVRGGWLHAFLTGIAFNLLVAIPGSIVALAFDRLARSANAEAVVVAGDVLFETLALSFVAVAGTLYYLDLRDRQSA
jgi:hypothetical protein